jgi:drug/metabolite transporter (DMT)-like permease
MLLLSAFMQFLGLSWVATFVKRFGTVVTMMTTSSRKVITVTLSYIAFPKPVSGGHFVGGGLVFIAIVMELYMKTRGAK